MWPTACKHTRPCPGFTTVVSTHDAGLILFLIVVVPGCNPRYVHQWTVSIARMSGRLCPPLLLAKPRSELCVANQIETGAETTTKSWKACSRARKLTSWPVDRPAAGCWMSNRLNSKRQNQVPSRPAVSLLVALAVLQRKRFQYNTAF